MFFVLMRNKWQHYTIENTENLANLEKNLEP